MADLVVQGVAFAGSMLGASMATLVPYIQKYREGEVIDGSKLKFDKKFLATAAMALIFGFIIAGLGFNQTMDNINDTDTLFTVFFSAFTVAILGNLAINRFIRPNSATVEAARAEKASLRDVDSTKAPI